MRYPDRLTIAAGAVVLGLAASGAVAQQPFERQVGAWTLKQSSTACVASSEPVPFPDGAMPPWENVQISMAEPGRVEVRYVGDIAAGGDAGEAQGQALMSNQGEPPEYFRPMIVIADHADSGRTVSVSIEGEAYDVMRAKDYFLLRAGEQMLPVALTPDPQALFDALVSCSSQLSETEG